ncbi:MAG: XTP/dITP diphosphatase [Thermoplasmataceae archaeon]
MILFVTSNSHKFQEIRELLKQYGIEIEWMNIKYEEIQASTTEEISADSAHKLASLIKRPFFIEDTGLYIEALNGFPGPYSSYVFSSIGNKGILKLLDGIGRNAEFRTVITYFDGAQYFQFTGKLHGTIADRERGNSGFGYDPIFIPDGGKETLGEMDLSQKNLISHRASAARLFADYIKGPR